MTRETELILRALDDLRDDLSTLRTETRNDFAVAFARLYETRTLVARIDERTRTSAASEDDSHDTPGEKKPGAVAKAVKRHAPAAGISALVVTLVEVIPALVRVIK